MGLLGGLEEPLGVYIGYNLRWRHSQKLCLSCWLPVGESRKERKRKLIPLFSGIVYGLLQVSYYKKLELSATVFSAQTN